LQQFGFSLAAGLPDGIFCIPKIQFWYIVEGLGLEDFGTSYRHLVCFIERYYECWVFMVVWYIFFGLGKLLQEKSGNPGWQDHLIISRSKFLKLLVTFT
jgi:hypothetical protein